MPAEPLVMYTRGVNTLISCSARLISILLLIIPGYFFIVVAPARRCPGSLLFLCTRVNILSQSTAGQPQCPRYVLNMLSAKRITLLSFALYYSVRSCSDMCLHIHDITAVCLSVMLSCRSCQKECTNIQALSESPLEVCILTRRVGKPCPWYHCFWVLVECEL